MKLHGGAIVDLGNVIIAHWLSNITPQNFHEIDYNSIPEVPGAFDSLKRLNERFGGNITVVYKATDIATEKIMSWLTHHEFTLRTGIGLDRVDRTRGGRDKTTHIDQSSSTHYGTTVVIDDRLEVMSFFVGKVDTLLLFRFQSKELSDLCREGKLRKVLRTEVVRHVCRVDSWRQIDNILYT